MIYLREEEKKRKRASGKRIKVEEAGDELGPVTQRGSFLRLSFSDGEDGDGDNKKKATDDDIGRVDQLHDG